MIKKVVIYDPTADAYREVDIEVAKKFVSSAKEVEAQIAEIESAVQKLSLEEAKRIIAEAGGTV